MKAIKAEKKRAKKIRKKNKRIYKFLLAIGFISMFLQLLLFSRTVISFILLLAIILISGFLSLFIGHKKYTFTYKLDGAFGFFYSFVQKSIIAGGIIGLLFLSVNYFFNNEIIQNNEYKIIERTSSRGRKYHRSERKPIFTVLIKERKKDFEFSNKFYEEMNEYNTITIETKKGFFGFDIITNRILNK